MRDGFLLLLDLRDEFVDARFVIVALRGYGSQRLLHRFQLRAEVCVFRRGLTSAGVFGLRFSLGLRFRGL